MWNGLISIAGSELTIHGYQYNSAGLLSSRLATNYSVNLVGQTAQFAVWPARLTTGTDPGLGGWMGWLATHH